MALIDQAKGKGIASKPITELGSIALGIAMPAERPHIFTRQEIAETFKKNAGANGFEKTIARLISEISREASRSGGKDTEDNW